MLKALGRGAVYGLMAFVVCLLVYLVLIRPYTVRWGSTGEEITRVMAGDELVKNPTLNATRAVTINARPEEIWPWLVQLGCKRAGWYSYDRIDNAGIPSADRIIPEFQRLEAGDLIPFTPDGKAGMRVKEIEPNKWMLWVAQDSEFTWSWGLYPLDDTRTRLITRLRARYPWTSRAIPFILLADMGDIVMMRKCMLGIKRRAEAAALKGNIR